MGYEIRDHLDEGWIKLIKSTHSTLTMEYILDKHNINLEDYWILKSSNRFRFINSEDIFKYAGIICFRKDMFKNEDIDKWLELIEDNNITVNYLSRPFPPVELLNKIKIIEWDIR